MARGDAGERSVILIHDGNEQECQLTYAAQVMSTKLSIIIKALDKNNFYEVGTYRIEVRRVPDPNK